MEYKSNIWSEEQLKKWYEILTKDVVSEPVNTTADFFCIAARKKYMTEDQKKNTNLGDTCMMAKQILKEVSFNKFLAKIHQVNASLDWFTDRDDNYLPRECMVFYMNVNHTDVYKAVSNFKVDFALLEYDVASTISFRNTEKAANINKQYKTIHNKLLKCFQDPKNTNKNWVDIDCDLKVTEKDCYALKELITEALKSDVVLDNVYVIKTHGGCHILISQKAFSEYNKHASETISDKKKMKEIVMYPDKLLKKVQEYFVNRDAKEIVINQNAMIPIPGTLQGGAKVELF